MDVQLHAFLTLALDDGEWLASRSGRFTPGDTHWIGGCVGPRDSLSAGNRISVVQPVNY
jgi:hypothetical protein